MERCKRNKRLQTTSCFSYAKVTKVQTNATMKADALYDVILFMNLSVDEKATACEMSSSKIFSSKIASENDSVYSWDTNDVAKWLIEEGFASYVDLISKKHSIDGLALINLSEQDLRQPPLSLDVLGDIKRLSLAIAQLKEREENAYLRRSAKKFRVFHNIEELSAELLIAEVESADTPNKSLLKTFLAGLYFIVVVLVTSFVMVIVHDRVPDCKTYPPLPDIFLDNIPLIPWAFDVCEVLAVMLCLIWVVVILLHRHRLVLMRRCFSLLGTVFMLRCVTMMITSLSVPGQHLECQARVTDWNMKISHAFKIWYGLGMSLLNVRTCGDYMFSGHTTVVTMLNHFITEYTPDNWRLLHTMSWVANLFAIFFILAAHEHYSLDVFVAFYISSRLFLYYHSLAYHASAISAADSRTRIWFPLFWFFESGGNVGRVPNEYEWPFPSATVIRNFWNGSYFVQASKIELCKLRKIYAVHCTRAQQLLKRRKN
ncbi:Sphingomyelin synthase-related protein 1 [Trichinella murrelli]|uniref:Sphingomyelin synthase-related protein 1 n=1 Tax=Trichinella murrelli TaxID=144512 RepID=A0A0V0TJ84_9BILA|nr:Sphingomyelin synthase-related protein 1 [Trichinella murrelli]KRX38978.1 Sphingomyelin synthase-related protein 1 [Trichinella murrelli]